MKITLRETKECKIATAKVPGRAKAPVLRDARMLPSILYPSKSIPFLVNIQTK